MKIMHLLAPAPFGGLERVVRSLATAQQARGLDVRVVALVSAGRPEPTLIGALRNDGVEVLTIASHGRAYRAQIRSIRELWQRHRPDILHTHGYLADVMGMMSAGRNGPALVSTAHGFTGNGLKNRLYEWIDRRAYRRFNAVVAVSKKLASDLEATGIPGNSIHTIVNAWASDATFASASQSRTALGVPDHAFSVGWVGRITREKGLDVLIEAIPLLRDLPIRVTVIGDGADRAALEQRAEEVGIANLVHWKGVQPDAARLLHGFDVLVISSRTEGTPMTLLEAMDAGTPVIATAVGGIPDVISHAQGILTPSEDSPALAAAIRLIHDDRDAAAARAREAKSRLQSAFAVGPWLDRHDQLYERITATGLVSR
jgi:glycosyltransferase involved in cell wall biosynthesis